MWGTSVTAADAADNLGALLLFWLGAKLGLERSIRGLSKLPLLYWEDFDNAAGWFRRRLVMVVWLVVRGIRRSKAPR